MQSIYRQFGISEQVLDYARPVLEALEERFKEIDATRRQNTTSSGSSKPCRTPT